MSFLCTTCKRMMCEDCVSIAEEYEQLLGNWKRQTANLEYQLEQLKEKLGSDSRRAEMYESIAKMGLPEIMHEWVEWKVSQ